MGYVLSCSYWIPWIWMSALGHPLHGIACGVVCWAVVMLAVQQIMK